MMRVATDIGGTFTDLVYINEDGEFGVAKSHTTPPNFDQGVIDVINKSRINQEAISTFIHGTTIIINALTEKKGVKTGLITTKGFRDVLEIARGNRPDLFNTRYKKPKPFVERVLRREVEERLNYKGETVTPLNHEDVAEAVKLFQKEKVEAIAVAYLHSYVNPIHEKETVSLIREMWPEVSVTASYETTKEWREYERTNTTILNAYVQPIAASYIDRLENKLKENQTQSRNYIMQSNGGTSTFNQAKNLPISLVESGPVAGILGAAVLGDLIGEKNIIAFDVGGTTAKCSLIENGEVKVSTDYFIERDSKSAGYPIKTPVVDIVEIGNGGGSIAWIDEAGALKVGPKSAGAFPGPVAYGQGGTDPTTTDANLYIGRLSSENFDYKVDMKKVKWAIEETVAEHFGISAEEAALGIIRIANSNMLNALKLISIRKGYNPREFTLVAFGGGGSMHAPALAKELGVKRVVIPLASPVFSAWGMLMTDLRQDYIQTYINLLQTIDLKEISDKWESIEQNALEEFEAQGMERNHITFSRYVDMRYVGQEHTVKVPVPMGRWDEKDIEDIVGKFHELHEKNYTFKLLDTQTEIVSLHLTVFGKVEKPTLKKVEKKGSPEDALKEVRPVFYEEKGWVDTKVYDRAVLPTDQLVLGPAVIEEKSAVTVIYEGQSLFVDPYGNLIIDTGVE